MRFAAKSISPPTAARRLDDKRPSLGKVITTLKAAVERLQVAQGLEQAKEQRQTTEYLVTQVDMLQNAFTSLADAVLEELDDLTHERLKVQAEQERLSGSVQLLEARLRERLDALERTENRLDAKESLQVRLRHEVDGLTHSSKGQAHALAELRSDLAAMQGQLQRMDKERAASYSDWASGPLNVTQRQQVRDLVGDVVRDTVPALIVTSMHKHVPSMVEEALDVRIAELRRELSTATGLFTADIARLGRDGQGLRGDLATVANITKKIDADVSCLQPRLVRLESAAETNPKASMRVVAALEDKLEALANTQARYGKSVESVVKALVDDTAALARTTRTLDAHYSAQQSQLQDTKEAMLRSAQVFSQLLKVPSPVSSAHWKSSSSSYSAAASSPASSSPGSPLISAYPYSKYGSIGAGLY